MTRSLRPCRRLAGAHAARAGAVADDGRGAGAQAPPSRYRPGACRSRRGCARGRTPRRVARPPRSRRSAFATTSSDTPMCATMAPRIDAGRTPSPAPRRCCGGCCPPCAAPKSRASARMRVRRSAGIAPAASARGAPAARRGDGRQVRVAARSGWIAATCGPPSVRAPVLSRARAALHAGAATRVPSWIGTPARAALAGAATMATGLEIASTQGHAIASRTSALQPPAPRAARAGMGGSNATAAASAITWVGGQSASPTAPPARGGNGRRPRCGRSSPAGRASAAPGPAALPPQSVRAADQLSGYRDSADSKATVAASNTSPRVKAHATAAIIGRFMPGASRRAADRAPGATSRAPLRVARPNSAARAPGTGIGVPPWPANGAGVPPRAGCHGRPPGSRRWRR